MFVQILTGSLLITLSILIMSVSVAIAVSGLRKTGDWIAAGPPFSRLTIVLTVVTLWLLAAISLAVWVWAAVFVALDIFDHLEPALYFAIVALTTLGFGDVILPQEWRLLSGFIAANGLVLFGLNTAFLIEVVLQLGKAQNRSTHDGNG